MSYLYIGGWKEISLVDVLEHVSFTLWTSMCNFQCPWCGNAPLARGVIRRRASLDSIVEAVKEAKDFVDYFHVTGGEPTLQLHALKELFRRVKEDAGILNSIDTNGSNPGAIKELLGLLDHIAIDVKAPLTSPEKYASATGLPVEAARSILPRVIESIKLSLNVGFVELRTTTVPGVISLPEVVQIARELSGIIPKEHKNRMAFVVQQFIPYEEIESEELRAKPRTAPEKVREAAEAASELLPIEIYYRTLEHGSRKIPGGALSGFRSSEKAVTAPSGIC